MKRYKLKIYDGKTALKSDLHFIWSLFRKNGKAILLAALFIGALVGLDYLGRFVFHALYESSTTLLMKLYTILNRLNHLLGVKYLDFFKDVVVMVAGILGVILGLFFTTFINIISTKYAHLNPIITREVLEGKVINKYFRLLTVLVVSAISFQFLLYCGYSPTIISSSIFTLAIIVAIISFVSYGKYSMMYFDAARVVSDIIKINVDAINRVTKNRKYISYDKAAGRILRKVIANNAKISTIIAGSDHPQLTNTSFDDVSTELREFTIGYNSIKTILPSNKDWFPTKYVHRKWEDASMTDTQMWNKQGFSLPPKLEIDYNAIEKQLIDIQFRIFNHYGDGIANNLQLLNEQFKYIQMTAFQCELEIFKSYFDNLESLILARLNNKDCKLNLTDKVSLASIYASHLVNYLVGLNHNFDRLITKNGVKKLASKIHSGKEITSTISTPYKIRKWIDDYQEKLNKEAYYEGKISTPLFHTEYELANQLQLVFKTHIVEVLEEMYGRVTVFGKKLTDGKHHLEAVEFLYESLDIASKSHYFTETIDNRIVELNELNLPKEVPFDFNGRETVLSKCDEFEKGTLAKIWDIWIHSSITTEIDDLPDMFGSIYNLLCKDIVKKALEDRVEFARYFKNFVVLNALYSSEIRKNIDLSNVEEVPYRSMSVYPIVVDLFEVCSIAIIMFKLHDDKELEKTFFDCLDNIFDSEKRKDFWTAMIVFYEWYKNPSINLFAPPNLGKQQREQLVSDYLKSSDIVRLEDHSDDFHSYQKYVTDSEDIYLKCVLRKLRTEHAFFEHLDLADLFIEFYLRKQPYLQDLPIKETEHGKYINT
jgi:hypothetical protein